MSPLRLGLALALLASPALAADRLACRPLPAAKADPALAPGQKVTTDPGRPQRFRYGDAVVYADESTAFAVAGGTLDVARGAVFVETAGKLTLKTPHHTASASDSRFGVGVGDAGTVVYALSGRAVVEGVKKPVLAGQIFTANEPRAARVSHYLDWTRPLRAASPVPASGHAGGSLVARDPDGGEAKLELRRYLIDTVIEDGFARTTIDQTYFNHAQDRIEGTFRFPLPPDASLCRLAMYVEGTLMEGGMADREHARSTYERIVWENRDPALLEWVDGSTFSMRVFPLEPRQEKRILLSYVQRLPALDRVETYRFPAGHSLGEVADWSLAVRLKGDCDWTCPSHALKASLDGGDRLLRVAVKNAKFDRDVTLSLTRRPAKGEKAADARFATLREGGVDYLLVRHTPKLAEPGEARRRDWVVVVETSGDRDPLLARTQVELVRSLLANAGRDDTFAVVAAATRARALRPKASRNEPAAVAEVLADLEKAHLIGAFDMTAALEAARPFLDAPSPHLVHVGSGIPAMGERAPEKLLARLPKGTRYVGVGVGRRWDRALMRALAEKTGGYYTQVNPDESAEWRGVELASALDAPRLLDVAVSGEGATFLPFSRLVSQGEEVVAVARLEKGLPKRVRVTGVAEGKAYSRELEVRVATEGAGYLPRAWAKLEIDRLLAEGAVENRKAVVELSKKAYVMTPYTSLLVLENEDQYKQFGIDRGQKGQWAAYPAPAKVPVVYEPVGGEADAKGIKPTRRAVAETLARRPTHKEAPHTRGNALRNVDPSPDALSEARLIKPFVGFDDRRSPVLPPIGGSSSGGRWEMRPSAGINFGFNNRDEGLDDSLPPGRSDGLIRPRPRAFEPASLGFAAGDRAGPDSERWRRASLEASPAEMLYERMAYVANDRLYSDLLAYAPGLNTSTADVFAVLDAEARPDPRDKPGRLDPKAKALIDAARQPKWRTLAVPASGLAPAYEIAFDGAGKYAWERTLSGGLKEKVVCDGKSLRHLYPELGLASRRAVSRHHDDDFAVLVPWFVQSAESLARGADVSCPAPHTVTVAPFAAKDAKKRHEVRIVFADGRVTERRLVEMPGDKVLRRERYSAKGEVTVVGPDDKAIATLKAGLSDASAPSLKADVKDLVVLDLPYRTPEHTRKAFGLKADSPLTFAQATQLLAASAVGNRADEARAVFQNSLSNRDQRQIGYYVLLAAAGVNLDGDNADVLDAHPHEPLAHYLSLHSSPTLRRHASRWAATSNVWGEGILRRLGHGHALTQRWSSNKTIGSGPTQRRAERGRALEYVRAYKGTDLAWGLLGLMQSRAAEEKDEAEKRAAYMELAKAYEPFAETFGPVARYEQARCEWLGGDAQNSRKRFAGLYRGARATGGMLKLDEDFRAAMAQADPGWADLLRETAKEMLAKGDRASVLSLAQQARQLDDRPAAGRLVEQALGGASVKGEKGRELYVSAVGLLAEAGQRDEADRLLKRLLDDPEHGKDADLWRRAAELAGERDQPERALSCLEQALSLEFAGKAGVVNMSRMRSEYVELLGNYNALTHSLATLKVPPPQGFRDKVVAAADRWRALDRDQSQACQLCAVAMFRLGERELAFDYLTTPVGMNPGESGPWLQLAASLVRLGERDQADRAYATAFEREGSNAQILFDRAENLRKAGRLAAAKALYKQVADGEWQPRFAPLRRQARWMGD